MPTRKSPRKGSLQFWPRKRAEKFLPSVNWDAINLSDSKKILKGFICYKAGMTSLSVKDLTPNSMTKDKKIAIPVTILECPPIKILSARFYKNGRVATEVLAESLDKEIKRKIKIPKKSKKYEGTKKEDYDDLRIIAYSVVKKTGIKKTPDITELGLNGSYEEKLNFVKENLGKEISVLNNFEKGELVDLRGLTKGKGLQGPVKRFGLNLKAHKSEKGVRRPGSLGPWHPARVTFRVPMAGQMGLFTRIVYNNKIVDLGKEEKKFTNLKNYGNVNSEYIIVKGSVQGPSKRQLILTHALRETKKQKKKVYNFIETR
ncbi:50S ribosomal protein L3 [Candidatus Pacearchaeota archaeon]|nr:50S ribosomal protein L3P [uncultured archaeon]MBS3084893.1 50S ribosomal protein L3 [Candidatus Pacearchaeota archaeon]